MAGHRSSSSATIEVPSKGWAAVAISGALVALANAAIFLGGWASPQISGSRDPPGWLVAAVWTVLFLLFGLAYRLLAPDQSLRRAGLALFVVTCLAYPVYTNGLANRQIGLWGNLVTAVFAGALIAWIWPVRRTAALLIAPVLPWLTFAAWTLSGSGV